VRSNLVFATLLVSVGAMSASTPKLNIKSRHGTSREERTKQQVERLAAQYDLKKFTKTRDIIIEQGAIAHAYPTLTMNCRFVDDDDLALSQYVHEQGHWVLQPNHPPNNPGLSDELQRLVPGLPIAYPAGAGDVRSTYYHLAVILLEWQGLEELIGPERARKVMEWKRSDHYTAIYDAVLKQRAELEKMLKRWGIHW